VFVSHAQEMIQYLCQRVVFLDSGAIVAQGDPEGVITQYENIQYQRDASYHARQKGQPPGFSTAQFSLKQVKLRSGSHQDGLINARDGFAAIFECESTIPSNKLLFSFDLLNHRREPCLWDVVSGDSLESARVVQFSVIVQVPPLPLSGGSYLIDFAIRLRPILKINCCAAPLQQVNGTVPWVANYNECNLETHKTRFATWVAEIEHTA
jgi:hypothetical protein